jgi:lysophospholipase L1-like esterase
LKNFWKPAFFVLFLLLLLLIYKEHYVTRIRAIISPQQITPEYVLKSSPYWSERVSLYEQLNCFDKIVFLGSSVTDDAEWGELFERNDIVNRGIGGDITDGVLKRIDFYLDQKPKCIFLKIGVNDIFWNFSIESIEKNYMDIIEKVRNKHIPLYIISTNVTSDLFANYSRINQGVKKLNDFLSEKCKLFNLDFVDINANLSKNNVLSDEYTYDGMHLTSEGYLSIKKTIDPYIRKIK